MIAAKWRDVAGKDVTASRVADKVKALSLERLFAHMVSIWKVLSFESSVFRMHGLRL